MHNTILLICIPYCYEILYVMDKRTLMKQKGYNSVKNIQNRVIVVI